MTATTSTSSTCKFYDPHVLCGEDYQHFVRDLNVRFRQRMMAHEGVFTTNITGEELWDTYLRSFPAEDRQSHNCNTCRGFLQKYAGLVVINDDGVLKPAFWDEKAKYVPDEYRLFLRRIAQKVRRATVTGVFLTDETRLGTPQTGPWSHFAFTLQREDPCVNKRETMVAAQAMAEKREDYKNVTHALGTYERAHVKQAVSLLRTDTFYRSEKVRGPAEWFLRLYKTPHARRRNLLWKAVATAPQGYCHPRSSMIGTLLDDLSSGMTADRARQRFDAKMNPLRYQRPQAAPSEGALDRAEKLVRELGLENSLLRRSALIEECPAVWSQPQETKSARAVFGHITAKRVPQTSASLVSGGRITWSKFARTVLPTASKVEVYLPRQGNYCGILTAADPHSPPLLQWDTVASRNPASWYVYNGGSLASAWSFLEGWAEVRRITYQPSMWVSVDKYKHQGKSVVFLVRGGQNPSKRTLGLFPEIIRADLREVRSVIEAHSRNPPEDREDLPGEQAVGLRMDDSSEARVRVTDDLDGVATYNLDRWE